ncbi:MAG: secretion protein HlyD family protein [bacterium]|nr:secretion protein HlyD family protein [bacterium]
MDPASQPSHDGNGRPHEDEHERDPEREDDREEEEPAPRPPLRERLRRWRRQHPRGAIIIIVALAALVAAAVVVWWYFHTHDSTDDAQIDGHISPVSARVSGTVIGVFVEDNQPVSAGQLLAQLDARDYQVARARAEADLAQARAQLEAEDPNVPITATSSLTQIATSTDEVESARAAVLAAERDAQSAQAKLYAADAADARAQADLARYKYLLGQRAIPPERYDAVTATAKSTHAEVESARALSRAAQKSIDQQQARLRQAMSRRGEVAKNAPRQLTIRQANIDAKAAAVQAAKAAVERARLDLEYTRIVAPLAGIIGKRSVELGQRVQPGESLLAVVDLDDLWVTANFKETQLRELRVGQPVRITVDALHVTIDGTVESFAAASGARYSLLPPENATGNYVKVVQRLPVRIRIARDQDPHRRLRVGMSVEPNVKLR